MPGSIYLLIYLFLLSFFVILFFISNFISLWLFKWFYSLVNFYFHVLHCFHYSIQLFVFPHSVYVLYTFSHLLFSSLCLVFQLNCWLWRKYAVFSIHLCIFVVEFSIWSYDILGISWYSFLVFVVWLLHYFIGVLHSGS